MAQMLVGGGYSIHDSEGHREQHIFSWGPLNKHQISETFCGKDVLAEEG